MCGKGTSKNGYLTLSFRPFMGEKPMTSMTLLTCEASALQYCTVASPSQTTLELPIGLLSNSLAEELIAFEEVYLHK